MTIAFVTHKLMDVMQHDRRVTVLRGGRVTGRAPPGKTDAQDLLTLMLGRSSVSCNRLNRRRLLTAAAFASTGIPDSTGNPQPVLEIRNLTVLNDRRGTAVKDVSLTVAPGEVLGVAGVDGSGQKELAQAVVGLRAPSRGEILGVEQTSRVTLSQPVRKPESRTSRKTAIARVDPGLQSRKTFCSESSAIRCAAAAA